MEEKVNDKLQAETYLATIKKHYDGVLRDMPALQMKICSNPKLSVRQIQNLRREYLDLQDTAHFLNSMYEAIDRVIHPERYESRIIAPPSMPTPKNGMKIIN